MRGRTTIIGIVVAIVVGSAVGGITFVITQTWEDKFNNLLDDYHSLYNDYNDLLDDYNDLLDDYNTLFNDYNFLFAQYESILSVLEDPLTNPTIPTIIEVADWLHEDDTDTHDWVNGVWECGDFSAMLMVRAKEMNWRMRIACMFYSFDDEGGYGDDNDPYGSHGHAFCCIETPDDDNSGDLDLIYIEPQTDAIWSVHNNNHFQIWTYYHFTEVPETWWYETYFWTNHYSYFA